MNERIDQLARAAGFKHPDHVGLCEEYAYFDHVRFAELIVDECCLKLLDMDEKTNGRHNYYKHAALELKRHVGVEE